MIKLKQKIQSKSSILEIVKGIFPYARVMFIYYCGSVAFGLSDENSDEDVTVVLDGFKGNVHLSLGSLDVFAYGRDIYQKKQDLDPSVPLYDRAYIDEVLSDKENLIYLDEEFKEEYEQYRNVNITSKLGLFLEGFVEHYQMRLRDKVSYKSNYHILRVRGILDHVDKTGKYELVVEEPWYSRMIEFKKNWNNELGIGYMLMISEQLNYIKAYKERILADELG